MALLEYEPVEVKVRWINGFYGTLHTSREIEVRLTRETEERIAIGKICRCGQCRCCATLKQYLDKLKNLSDNKAVR